MRIGLTGAFGNIGSHTIPALLDAGHSVRALDLDTPATRKQARRLGDRVEIQWGDIRDANDLANFVQDLDAIIHLAFILPPASDENPKLAYAVNVEGTRQLLDAARHLPIPPRFLYASTLDLFGDTFDQPPPRRVTDPISPTDDYTRHKLLGEEMVHASGLAWAIFRFADVPLLAPRAPHPIMFRIPLRTRIEALHPADAGLAIACATTCDPIWGRTWLIGGGPTCQVTYREYVGRMLSAVGIGPLPDAAFGTQPYCTDWLDTEEGQRLLRYQRHTFDEIVRDVARANGPVRYILPLIRPLVRSRILALSPYWHATSTTPDRS